MAKKPKPVFAIILVALVLGFIVYSYQRPISSSGYFIKDARVVSPIDGALVDKELADRRPLAIVVENHPQARPQSGLSQASVIYEAIAEGEITRYLAIFGPRDAELVGPVRSARTFSVEWAKEWAALYAHIGGNQEAKNLIAQYRLDDLDQFRLGEKAYERRAKNGVASEHTIFTSTKKLYEIAATEGKSVTGAKAHFSFKDDSPTDSPQAYRVEVDFSTDRFKISWLYDESSNSYRRRIAQEDDVDVANNRPILAKNIVVMTVRREPSVSEINESSFKFFLDGEGELRVFQDGGVIFGQWRRKKGEKVRFIDRSGQEIGLNRGQIWIEVVPPEADVLFFKA